MSVTLHQPRTVFVEPIDAYASTTSSGLIAVNEDYKADMGGNVTTMLLRVTGRHPTCDPEVRVGEVYVAPVYCFETVTASGETFHVTHEANLQARIVGYDDPEGGDRN